MEEVQINQIDWGHSISRKLEISAGNDLALIKSEVEHSQSQLWRCQSFYNLAFVVTRIEHGELVIVLFEGSGLNEFMPFFIKRAIELKLSIRAHVKRKGLLKMGRKLGFELSEYVIRYQYG